MYALLWRKLPGPVPVRVLTLLVLLFIISMILLLVVFPYVSSIMPYNDVSV